MYMYRYIEVASNIYTSSSYYGPAFFLVLKMDRVAIGVWPSAIALIDVVHCPHLYVSVVNMEEFFTTASLMT